jgi:UDP-N-acetylmuramoyl-L-alanyl-D-glutamate--2,6-diaminopimelate ligase
MDGIAPLSVSMGSDPEISGIEYDSRKVGKGNIFLAFPGLHADGNAFVDAAIKAGAVAVVHERELPRHIEGVCYIQVADARRAASRLAAAFNGEPSRSLGVIGVTGTEGKSTTVSLIYQLLTLAGRKAGFFSTVMSDIGTGEQPNPEHQTTPEATTVQAKLAAMRDAGCEFAVVESSSHGLSERTARLQDVEFDVGVMTNVTSEHLEFHGTWERYRSDKANLFRRLASREKTMLGKARRLPCFGVANADDPSAAFFAACTDRPVITYSAKGAAATLLASSLAPDRAGSNFLIEGPADLLKAGCRDANCESSRQASLQASAPASARAEARINLPGDFNVGNSLAALAVVSAITDTAWTSLVPLLARLRPVRGRMMTIERGQPFEVLIDYAHTPSSFETILPPIRARVKGRIFCVFGSGGERDTEKRPRQGEIAARWCDVVVLADEDPRGEEPMALLEDIAAGCPSLRRNERLFLIPDRPTAIRKAFSMAREGDAVLLLGKGHENSIIYANRTMPYDEEAEATAALAELGYDRAGL